MQGTSWIPRLRSEPIAALSWPRPPSITIKSGNFSTEEYLRRTSSPIIAKSFCPTTVLILNFLYADLFGLLLANLTHDPTAIEVLKFETLKTYMTSGMD